MKKISGLSIFLIVALIWLPCVSGYAAEENESKDIVSRIIEESEGNVTIDIPENILTLILTSPVTKKKTSEPQLRPGINKMDGYRIQVFSDGRNQGSLEARAKARGSAILAKFPKYRGQIYTFSSSPNWYTRVGNFRNQSEATAALEEMKRAFPAFASEMRVVKCKIVVVR